MSPLKRVFTTVKIGVVSAWLAWQYTGKIKPGETIHFNFTFRYKEMPPA